jgi:hypothetical protein
VLAAPPEAVPVTPLDDSRVVPEVVPSPSPVQ